MQLNRVRALASLVLCLFCSAVLDAATVPVDVDFAIDVAGMRNAWTPAEQQQIVSEVRKSLVEYLHTTYRYWAFQEKTGQAPVVLSFKVVETIPNQISLRLEFLLGGVRSGSAEVPDKVWLKPADVALRGYPASTKAAKEIFTAFKSGLLEASASQIDAWLKKEVPIASGGQWLENRPEPRIVIPLSWEEFKMFSLSVFRLACLSPQQLEAEL